MPQTHLPHILLKEKPAESIFTKPRSGGQKPELPKRDRAKLPWPLKRQKPREILHVKAVLDLYNPTGSSIHVNFNTTRTFRWETDARRCHVNWVILDSDWEAEFCRVAESHPKVIAYVKNHNLGLGVPYRYGSTMRTYIPDFIVLVDDGGGAEDPLHLIVEIKGYRREDAKEKKATMETYWVPGVNNSGQYGRWAFVEFTNVSTIESDFKDRVEAEFNEMIERISSGKERGHKIRKEGKF